MRQKYNNLLTIPGVGTKLAQNLWAIGITRVSDLKNKDPEKLYLKLCAKQGHEVDRCVLYVFRCAVYFASNKKHQAYKLKWWSWKDTK